MADPKYEDTEALPEPKYEDTVPHPQDTGPSSAEAALEGAKASVPFSNQLAGGTQGILDLLGKLGIGTSVSGVNKQLADQGITGKGGAPLPGQTTGDVYAQGRDASRAQQAAMQSAHPLAYLAGNLGGGAVMMAPVMGAAGLAGKAAAGLAPETAAALTKFGGMAAQEAPALAAIGKGAATGALAGGLYGAGEGNALKGAAVGGIGGAALSAIPQGLGALRDLVNKYKVGKQLGRSFELGEQGQGISSEADIGKITDQVNQQAQKLTDFISDTAEKNWKQKLEVLKNSGQQFDLNTIKDLADQSVQWAIENNGLLPDQADRVRQTIQQTLYKQLPDETKKIVNSVIKTTKVRTLNTDEGPQQIEDTIWKAKGMSPEELQNASQELNPEQFNSLSSTVKENPEFPEAPSTTHTEGLTPPAETGPATPELRGDEGQVPATEAAQIVRNLGKFGRFDTTKPAAEQQVLQNIAGKASGAMKEAYPQTEPLTENLSTLKQLTEQLGGEPDEVKALGISPATSQTRQLVEQMGNVSDAGTKQQRDIIMGLMRKVDPEFASKFETEAGQASLDKSLTAESGKAGIGSVGQLVGAAKGVTFKAANLAGQVSKNVTNIATWPVQKVQAWSNSLMARPDKASQTMGKMLNSVATGAPEKRNAMLFAISQNKDYRDLIDQVTPDVGTPEQK